MYIDDFNSDYEARSPRYPLKFVFSEEFMKPYREFFNSKALGLGTKENPMISLTDEESANDLPMEDINDAPLEGYGC
jgi:hypothetical protein